MLDKQFPFSLANASSLLDLSTNCLSPRETTFGSTSTTAFDFAPYSLATQFELHSSTRLAE
jgi:hypothetical protein